MKTYTLEIVITEGSDEFWEGIADKTGCDDVLEALTSCLNDQGWEPAIRLTKFEENINV